MTLALLALWAGSAAFTIGVAPRVADRFAQPIFIALAEGKDAGEHLVRLCHVGLGLVAVRAVSWVSALGVLISILS